MTVALSSGFGLTFLCFLTLETLLTTLMKSREDLSEEVGFASLSSVYLAFAISSVTCHVACRAIGLKGAIIVGVALYSIWAAIMAAIFHLSQVESEAMPSILGIASITASLVCGAGQGFSGSVRGHTWHPNFTITTNRFISGYSTGAFKLQGLSDS